MRDPIAVRILALLGVAIPGATQDLASLKDLLNTPVIGATQVPMSARETPGVITVIHRRDILAMGARDLLEVLQSVPGLSFGSDTNGVVGLGVRTAWAHGGKVLLLFDGLEMNETLYTTNQFGFHYPVGNIERIEVIRGPGSVRFGGYAELAVINIISRTPEEMNGGSGELWLGRMAGADQTRAQGQFQYGSRFGEHAVGVSFARGEAPSGRGSWMTPSGTTDFGADGRAILDFLNLDYRRGAFKARYIRDNYQVVDNTYGFFGSSAWNKFPGDYVGVEHAWTWGQWTFTPRATYKRQRPWNYTEAQTDRNARSSGELTATWIPTPNLRVSFGGEATQDHITITYGGFERLVFNYRAYLAQVQWLTDVGNVDFGIRYDTSSVFASTTSPRLAFTRATERWHLKLLAGGAFRAPSIENLRVNPNLRPERTTTYEVEVGREVGPATYLTANLFRLRIRDPIAYANPAPSVNTYLNFDQTGATGFEVVLRHRRGPFSLVTSVAHARAEDREADFYAVPGRPELHVGFSPWTGNLTATWAGARASLGAELRWRGSLFAYRAGDPLPSRFPSQGLVDVHAGWAFTPRLNLGLKVSNLLDAEAIYPQPYGTPGTGGTPSMPGPGPEVALRLSMTF